MRIKNKVVREYINAFCIIAAFLFFFIDMDNLLNKIYQPDEIEQYGEDYIP